MKNILILITTQTKDGPGNVLINLINHLNENKYKICVAYLYFNDHAKENIFDHISKPVKFINLNMKSPLNGWIDILVIKRIRKIITEYHIDILHMHLHRAIIFGTLAVIGKNIKTIATIHNMEPHQTPRSLFELAVHRLENLALQKVKFITAVSNAVKNSVLKHYKGYDHEKMVVVNNGILSAKSTNRSPDLKSTYCINGDALILACIGRLEPQKGIEYLITALAEINTRPKLEYRLFVIGEGEKKSALEDLVKSKKLCKHVVFTGYLDNVMDILNEVDILVMPSLFEGLPMVLLEAMSKGVCCLGTDAGGIPEVISGIVPVVEKENSTMLADILYKYMLDADLRKTTGERLKERFEKLYTAEIMAKNYEAIYDSRPAENHASLHKHGDDRIILMKTGIFPRKPY